MEVFFHEFAKERRPETKKPCARLRDADRIMISVRRSCHGFQISDGVHPFGYTGALPVAPSRRIAAGLSVGVNAKAAARLR
jgi:hypothetical protein